MKLLYIFLATVLSINAVAQFSNLNNEFSWESVEKLLSDEEKLDILSKINESLFYYLEDNHLLREKLGNFHFFDLNNDDLLDFVYVGYSGAEQPATLVFTQNEKGYYKKILEASGVVYDITNITLVSAFYQLKIVNNDGCYDCLGVKNLSTYFYNGGDFERAELISFTKETVMPSIEFKKQFKIINQKYYLRSSPEINNEGDKPDVLFGNVIAQYQSDVKGYALAHKEDHTGRTWWFVAIEANKSTRALFQQKEGYYVGWMSSRFLEEI